jgi:hypothetical protein
MKPGDGPGSGARVTGPGTGVGEGGARVIVVDGLIGKGGAAVIGVDAGAEEGGAAVSEGDVHLAACDVLADGGDDVPAWQLLTARNPNPSTACNRKLRMNQCVLISPFRPH